MATWKTIFFWCKIPLLPGVVGDVFVCAEISSTLSRKHILHNNFLTEQTFAQNKVSKVQIVFPLAKEINAMQYILQLLNVLKTLMRYWEMTPVLVAYKVLEL